MKIIPITRSNGNLLVSTATPTCFVLLNQSFTGSITLAEPGAQAFVLGLFTGTDSFAVHIDQRHQAKNTTSQVVLRSLVKKGQEFSYQGNIHITEPAGGSVASQEARGLLLSPEAKWKAVPSLEILPNDVVCRHQATASPLSKESLYFLCGRGLTEDAAKELLQKAFILSALDALPAAITDQDKDVLLESLERIL